ncbi:MAG TPA: hypothetical protein VFA65_01980 [Bryobacteraceae bacterium]|nr:hypothetical protein [Bryobacteraceae bacterium]
MLRFFALLTLVVLTSLTACTKIHDPLPGFPKLVLWAWERPENLSYLVPSSTGVAYLADTISFESDGLHRRPRFQPLRVPAGTSLISVIRIESRSPLRPPVGDVVNEILRVVAHRQIRAVQMDYDARASERVYYRDLMQAIRGKLPRKVALEMTALVSWCQGDDWIHSMPVVDAVPMFFRMGADPHSTRERLREPLCESGIGISTDEFYVPVPRGKRVYVFADRPWTEITYRAVLQASRRWS